MTLSTPTYSDPAHSGSAYAVRVGTAWEDITPSRSIPIQGQMHVRYGKYTRDPLTVNAAVFDDGARRSAIVSIDLCMMPNALAESLRAACARTGAVDADSVVVATTHTHVGPCTSGRLFGEADPEFLARLEELTARAVARAAADLSEASLHAGTGYVEHMGWNRRGLRRDGQCHMYWGSWREGFTGIEGPRDGSVNVICARRPDGSVKLVVSSFSTHPNTLEGESFYSADIPGEVRRVLRAVYGPETGVVYLTGAAGNTAPSIMEANPKNTQPWRGEDGLRRSGQYLGGEILRTIAAAVDPMPEPVLRHERAEFAIPIRPWDLGADYSEFGGGMKEFFDKSREDWDRMLREDVATPVRVSAIRIGDAAILANPAELYCEFGLAMKENSPARVNLVTELADGWCGYVATPQAIKHGGYSALASHVSWLAHDAGWQIVEATKGLLARAFA